jgi:hypothetical protein
MRRFTPQTVFDYDRTVVAFHGTRRAIATKLVDGDSFDASTNDDDWLGHGIYFWEYAPQRAWAWARQRYDAMRWTRRLSARSCASAPA